MNEEYIKIKQVRNGYLVNYKTISEETGDYEESSLVFEEKEKEGIANYNISKERIECFRDLVEFLEIMYGVEGNNSGDNYLSKEIKMVTKNE